MNEHQDEPFDPIVESLVTYPTDSAEWADAASVAGPAEIAEARRQVVVKTELLEERQDEIERRMAELEG